MKNFKLEFKWAFIFIACLLVWMVLERLVGLHDQYIAYHVIITNFFAIPAVIVYILALKDKKKRFYNEIMTYKQGFVFGLIVSIIITIFTPITQWVISYIVTPNYFTNVIAYSVETGVMDVTTAKEYFSYKNYVIQGSIFGLLMGIVTTAIVALFVKSKQETISKNF